MAKEYKIWVSIEEHDTETDEYNDIQQEYLGPFDSLEETKAGVAAMVFDGGDK